MAYFAEINNHVVVRVLAVSNDQEHRGQEFLADDLGLGGEWIQTSFNGNIRGHFAGIGDKYDQDLDIFIAPKPFPSWIMLPDGFWKAPIEVPDDGQKYAWDESVTNWVVIES